MVNCSSAAVTKMRRFPRTEGGKDIEVTRVNSPSKNVKVKKSRITEWYLEENLG